MFGTTVLNSSPRRGHLLTTLPAKRRNSAKLASISSDELNLQPASMLHSICLKTAISTIINARGDSRPTTTSIKKSHVFLRVQFVLRGKKKKRWIFELHSSACPSSPMCTGEDDALRKCFTLLCTFWDQCHFATKHLTSGHIFQLKTFN